MCGLGRSPTVDWGCVACSGDGTGPHGIIGAACLSWDMGWGQVPGSGSWVWVRSGAVGEGYERGAGYTRVYMIVIVRRQGGTPYGTS